MRCMKKTDENTVEKFSIIKLISSEAFVEQEHPRDEDGKFTSKGGGGINIEDHMDKVDKLKDDLYIKEILKSDGIPNEMELEKARLTKIVDEERKVDSDRKFEYNSSGGNVYKMNGTQEFENSMNDLSKHNEKIKIQQKEYDEGYRESYGWKEGDPLRWTEYNDDGGDSSEYGYGANYTYKHLDKKDKDVLMRSMWNSKTRNEREDEYDYLNSQNIPYVNKDGKTPEDLRDDLGKDKSIPSDYFFFTDKETRNQFSGKGMTEEEIKERADTGIGTYHNVDGSIDVVYDRPLNYDKFNSKRIGANNFGEKGEKTDKLWDDLSGSAKSSIISEYRNYDGVLYNEWLDKERGDYYKWRKGQDGVLSEQEENHSKMYSEYGKPEETATTLNDEEKLEFAKTLWKQEYLDKHTDNELIDKIKGEYEQYALEDKEQRLWQEKIPKTYFGKTYEERSKDVGKLFDSKSDAEKSYILDIDESEIDEDTTWDYLEKHKKSKIQRDMENDEYQSDDLEAFSSNNKQMKVIGFDYENGIPEKQTTDTLKDWGSSMRNTGNRLRNSGYLGDNTPIVEIPNYPKVETRSLLDHRKQVAKLNNDMQKNLSSINDPVSEEMGKVTEYIKDNIQTMNINKYLLNGFKIDFSSYVKDSTDEDVLRMYAVQAITGNLSVQDNVSIWNRAEQTTMLSQLIKDNPPLSKMYDKVLTKMDAYNKDNYDLFVKTPEFYRGTTTQELDDYLADGKMSGGKYSFVSASMDRKQATGNSQINNKWTETEEGGFSGGRVVIVYDGNSTRSKAIPVQYNPAPIAVNFSFGDPIEHVNTPYQSQFYNEREVRMNVGENHPEIIELNFGEDTTPQQQKFLTEKYGKLTKTISFNKFSSNEAFQEEEHPRDDDGKFTDKGSTSPKTVREFAKDVTVYSYKELIQKHSDRGYGFGEQWHNDLTNPIINKEDLKTFYEAKQKWEELLKIDEPLRLGFNKIKEDMTEYNGMLKNKFDKSDTFYRGTTMKELQSYLEKDCIGCDFKSEYTGDSGKTYNFVSLSMDTDNLRLFSSGAVIEFDAESIRNAGGKNTTYSADPVPFKQQSTNNISGIEGIDKPYSMRFADEQEVRLPKTTPSEIKIKRVHIDMSTREPLLREIVGLPPLKNADEFHKGADMQVIKQRLQEKFGGMVGEFIMHDTPMTWGGGDVNDEWFK
mgnify:FL=1